MIICINPACKNHRQELDAGTELCPICGVQTGIADSKTNKNLSTAAVIASIVGALMSWITWNTIGITIGIICAVAGIILGIMSKSKLAIAAPIIAILSIVGWLLMYGVL